MPNSDRLPHDERKRLQFKNSGIPSNDFGRALFEKCRSVGPMLSKKAKYGIRALLCLAERRGQGPIMIKDIAQAERIPKKFLEAILVDLKSGGLLRSRSGRSGGYELLRSPKEINLGQVIRLMDGPLAPTPCVSQMAYAPCDDCVDERTCLIRMVMKNVRDATARILEQTTLEGMLLHKERFRSADSALDFHI